MPSIESIYQQTILPLPPDERIKLARIILDEVEKNSAHRSAYDVLEDLSVERLFNDSNAVDAHLESERGSWDN